ncbi:TetR/AcrR family transcriptional regulator [Ferrimonas sediminicola]|nr:TetR/AcrR family transcriptional regulator [Ferrimonas sediminicola]
MQAGQRQKNRTVTRLINAFTGLIGQRHYQELGVAEIAEAADVGRSTFYRHFKSKADLLVGLHRSIFRDLFADLQSSEQWLAETPPPSLERFLEQYQKRSDLRRAVAYRLGADTGYVSRHTRELLTSLVEENLSHCFADKALTLPLPLLAHSIAGSYAWMLTQWLSGKQSYSNDEMALHIHQLSRAAIVAALNSENRG